MIIYTSEDSSQQKHFTRKKFIKQKQKRHSVNPVLYPLDPKADFKKLKGVKSMKIISLSEEFQDLPRTRFFSWNTESEQSKFEKDQIIKDEQLISRKPTISQEKYNSESFVKKELTFDKLKLLLDVPRHEMYGKILESRENCNLVSSGDSTPHLYVDYKHRIEGLLLLNFTSGDEGSLNGSPSTK